MEKFNKWSPDHIWYAYRCMGEKNWHIDNSRDGSCPRCEVIGWFSTGEDANKYVNNLDKFETNNKESIDITGLTEEEAIAKVRQAYKKSWLDNITKEYVEDNHDESLCYYVGFDETEDVDDRLVIEKAVKYGATKAVEKLIENLKEKDLIAITVDDITDIANELGI